MKGFSDAERERIRERLLAEGRDLFERYGLRKTTIADLTGPVGIAASTFYQFFDSKEALYLEILEAEGQRLAERVLADSFGAYDDPERAIAAFLDAIMAEIETNPLVQRLIVGDELDRLRDQFTDEELRAERDRSITYFLPHIERWHEEGRLAGTDPVTVAHAIRAVTFVTLHEEDIGADRYPTVRDQLIAAVASGLTREA